MNSKPLDRMQRELVTANNSAKKQRLSIKAIQRESFKFYADSKLETFSITSLTSGNRVHVVSSL